MSWIKDKIKSWLEIEHANNNNIYIIEPFNYDTYVMKNNIWYRGDEFELQQLFSQITDEVNNGTFWSATSTTGINFRKIHSGLPKIIINTLVDVVIGDLNEISIDNVETPDGKKESNEEIEDLWEEIAKDNSFSNLLNKAIKTACVKGDGAFKISLDPSVSQYPIIEFYDADRVKYNYKRGRIDSIVFVTQYIQGISSYILEETYSKVGIQYKLYNKNGDEVSLDMVDEIADLEDVTNPIEFQKIMAVPLMFEESLKWIGRGESLIGGKSGAFDAFDEIVSQWVDALRDGRTTKYIPETMLPHNPTSGAIMKPNSFDNRYIKIGSNLAEDSENKIDVVAGEINADELLATYCTFLDLCLQGLISPSTLGIDVKKLDNADSQREKEKVTLYTRGKLITVLETVIPQLISTVLNVYEADKQIGVEDHEVSITFGEYANPSFEAVVETIVKAKTGGIMSTEQAIEEMYGSTWSDEEKEEEVNRLKNEQGVIEMEKDTMKEDLGGKNDEDTIS